MLSRQLQLFYGLLFWLLLAAGFLAYQSGLQGGFILDDEVNLRGLLEIGATGNDTGHDILAFSLQGGAGPLGRPVSLLSFALQFHYAHSAAAFKYVNLCIHLLIASLICWWLVLVGRLTGLTESRALPLALAAAGIWLLLPIQVSTVLYVVQRMTELAALFTVMGLLGYTCGRAWLAQNRVLAGYAMVSLSLGGFGLLAVLSKENGALLLLYAIVLEATLFATLPRPRYWMAWCWSFLYLPMLGLFGYLLWQLDPVQIAEMRDFTVYERLLTQPRILLDYLFNIFVPRPQALSLFHDDYPVSRSLIDPPATLIALAMLLAALGSALWLRRRYPLYAFGVLWFLAGHALESSFLPLMLYFEHRNYLALLGPVVAVLYNLPAALPYLSTRLLRYTALTAGIIWLGLILWTTWVGIRLWNQPTLQAVYWAEQSPRSLYALSHAALSMRQTQRPAEAVAYYRRMLEIFPDDTGPYVFWLGVACHWPHLRPELSQVQTHFQHSQDDFGMANGLYEIVENYTTGNCPGIPLDTFIGLLETLVDNPKITFNRGSLYVLLGRLYELKGDYARALVAVEQALALNIAHDVEIKILKLLWLARAGHLDEASAYAEALLQQDLSPTERLTHGYQISAIMRKVTQAHQVKED
jgi:tetratricopeptide (TPR) repeat protein